MIVFIVQVRMQFKDREGLTVSERLPAASLAFLVQFWL